MDVEKVSRKKNGKNGAPRKSSNLDQYIAEQEEKVQMNEEAAGMSSFDSLRTALLQCIQVRDHELLKALLQNDVILLD